MANDRSLPTRERLLKAALLRFSTDGWGGTSIRDLARDVGIRESSVYKHFSSKRAIFEALLELADERLGFVASQFGVSIASPDEATPRYQNIPPTHLEEIALGFFDAVVHDPELSALRRLLIVNQYRDDDAGDLLRSYWLLKPLEFQSGIFARLIENGEFHDDLDPDAMALAFFGPIFMLLQLADNSTEAEAEARQMLRTHVQHFLRTHLGDTA